MNVSQLSSNPVSLVKQWLENKLRNDNYHNINLELLGFDAAQKAKNENLSKEERLEWAEVALRAYSYSEIDLPADQKGATMLSQMYLRASMIAAFGIDHTNQILNPDLIFTWLNDALAKIDMEKIEEKFPWYERNLDKIEICNMRQIKNILSVIEVMYPDCVKNDTLDYLFSIKDKLP